MTALIRQNIFSKFFIFFFKFCLYEESLLIPIKMLLLTDADGNKIKKCILIDQLFKKITISTKRVHWSLKGVDWGLKRVTEDQKGSLVLNK